MEKEFKNKTVYIRESYNEKHYFTIISNHLVKDERLTATEKGLMLMILSNSNSYILNSSYLQKESRLGKTTFNKSMKKLQSLGYLLKKPLNNGGYKWIVIESTLMFEDLKKVGYISYDQDKSTLIINDAIEPSVELFDFHRKLESGNPDNKKPENSNPYNKIPENRPPELQPIINNNSNNTNIGINKNEKIENRKDTNETLARVDNDFDNYFELETSNQESDTEYTPQVKNSLPIILEYSESYREMFKRNGKTLNDFNGYRDTFIALIALASKLSESDHEWEEVKNNLNYDKKLYGEIVYACRYALTLQIETELKKELLSQSKLNEAQLYKLFFG